MTLYNEDFSDISNLSEEEDGTPITIDTDLLCNSLEIWVQLNLSKGSRSVFYQHIKEEDIDSYEAAVGKAVSYEVAVGKAVANEVIVEALKRKAEEVIAEHEKNQIPPEPVMPENEVVEEYKLGK